MKIIIYEGELPDGEVVIHVGDNPILELEVFDSEGVEWESGYEAYLVVRRCEESSLGEIVIDELAETTPYGDNNYFFELEDVSFEEGDYEAFLLLEGDYDYALTTPVSTIYSFEPFKINVVE